MYLPFSLSLYLVVGNFFLLLHNTSAWMLPNMASKLYFGNCTGKDMWWFSEGSGGDRTESLNEPSASWAWARLYPSHLPSQPRRGSGGASVGWRDGDSCPALYRGEMLPWAAQRCSSLICPHKGGACKWLREISSCYCLIFFGWFCIESSPN